MNTEKNVSEVSVLIYILKGKHMATFFYLAQYIIFTTVQSDLHLPCCKTYLHLIWKHSSSSNQCVKIICSHAYTVLSEDMIEIYKILKGNDYYSGVTSNCVTVREIIKSERAQPKNI